MEASATKDRAPYGRPSASPAVTRCAIWQLRQRACRQAHQGGRGGQRRACGGGGMRGVAVRPTPRTAGVSRSDPDTSAAAHGGTSRQRLGAGRIQAQFVPRAEAAGPGSGRCRCADPGCRTGACACPGAHAVRLSGARGRPPASATVPGGPTKAAAIRGCSASGTGMRWLRSGAPRHVPVREQDRAAAARPRIRRARRRAPMPRKKRGRVTLPTMCGNLSCAWTCGIQCVR